MLRVIIIQCIVKIGLVTEMFIPNYQLLFIKLTQLAQLSKKNLGKPRLNNIVLLLISAYPENETSLTPVTCYLFCITAH